MSSTQSTLDAAATDRKARLAKLASLKRKQPGSDVPVSSSTTASHHRGEEEEGKEDRGKGKSNNDKSRTNIYLSGRNYDKETKSAKLGFENIPGRRGGEEEAEEDTVERQAERLTLAAAEQAAKDEAEAEKGGIDLFKLQPKKPNWDLKRDLAEKMQVLDVRTQNAIARLVRDRIQSKKEEALSQNQSATTKTTTTIDGGEEVGIDGSALVEGVHVREREEEEAERRAQELEDDENDAR